LNLYKRENNLEIAVEHSGKPDGEYDRFMAEIALLENEDPGRRRSSGALGTIPDFPLY
jgi:hypothetical protein